MKNLFYIFFVGLSFLATSTVSGQGENPHFLKAMANSDGQSIKIRWIASDYETWQEGNTAGYTIERYTTHQNGTLLDPVATFNSKVVLSSNLQALSAVEWDSQFSGNNFGQLAKGALYDDDVTIELSADPKLADALNYQESQESRLLFALFAAEQDFSVAQGMALAFEDMGVAAGEAYMYFVKLNSTDPEFEGIKTAARIETDDVPVLPAITGLTGEPMDKIAIIQWRISDVTNAYSSYDIERSTDGTNFSKINDLPFIFGTDATDDPEFAVYRDSLDDNTTTYYYRVKGRNPFGLGGPPSNVVDLQGLPPRMEMFLTIDTLEEGTNVVNVKWDSFDSSFESEIEGFNLYRSLLSSEGFEQVNTTMISASERAYTDANPIIPTAYYKLEALDKNGHYYSSPATLLQCADSIPPAVPTGLTGTFVTSKTLQLEWTPNTEEDLKGYRVLMANGRNTNYIQVTSRALAEAKYIHEIDPKFEVDSIFFKVIATDLRDNYSERSEIYAIARPDIIPPSKPLLYKVSPTPGGIEIGFRFSSSDDVTRHMLQRKPANTPGWQDILEVVKANESEYEQNLTPGNITSTCYLDTTILERREYQYRILSYDDQENVSSSEVITMRPYDSGKRGEIDAVKAKARCIAPPNIASDPIYQLIERLLGEYETMGYFTDISLGQLVTLNVITNQELQDLLLLTPYEIYVYVNQLKIDRWGELLEVEINLAWDYAVDDQLVDFQIYRSAEGSSMALYKTLKVTNLAAYTFKDEDAKPGRRYFYQVMARHLGGGFSERSDAIMVKVPKY